MPEWRLRPRCNIVYRSPRLGSPQSCIILKQISCEAQNGIIRSRVAGRCQSYRTEPTMAKGTYLFYFFHYTFFPFIYYTSVTLSFCNQAYYRQGVALQCLGRHGEALVAFSTGLAHDASNHQLLSGLVEASLKSPLRTTLEPTFQQLRAMKLDESPFVVISVVGQELLGAGQYRAAAGVLEAALTIGSCSLKLRGSVFSALSSAYWALNSLDKAINYMQQDLGKHK